MKRFSHPDWRTIGIVGGATTTVYDISSGVLELAVPDSYELLPTKIQAAFSWIYNTFPSSPGVFKTDDDMVYDDLAQLSKAIQENIQKCVDYWGVHTSKTQAGVIGQYRIQNRFEDKTLRPRYQAATYCFGAGYWVSRVSMGHISKSESAEEYQRSYLEDVCTGFVLNQQGIFPKKVDLSQREIRRNAALLSC